MASKHGGKGRTETPLEQWEGRQIQDVLRALKRNQKKAQAHGNTQREETLGINLVLERELPSWIYGGGVKRKGSRSIRRFRANKLIWGGGVLWPTEGLMNGFEERGR